MWRAKQRATEMGVLNKIKIYIYVYIRRRIIIKGVNANVGKNGNGNGKEPAEERRRDSQFAKREP